MISLDLSGMTRASSPERGLRTTGRIPRPATESPETLPLLDDWLCRGLPQARALDDRVVHPGVQCIRPTKLIFDSTV